MTMKRSPFKRKEGYKGLSRTKKLSTSRTVRRDQGQRRLPTLPECAQMFGEAMRLKWKADGTYACAKCGQGEKYLEPLEVSHFFNVRKSGARFDPRNVDPLHRDCHTGEDGWEYQKHKGGEYLAHMLEKLGPVEFIALSLLSQQHVSLEEAKAEFIERLGKGTLWSSD